MNAKRFFYVCAGILLLVAAYTLGASRAQSQAGNAPVGITALTNGPLFAVTANGDVYKGVLSSTNCSPRGEPCVDHWVVEPNIFSTVSLQGKTWGAVKDGYRK